MIVSGELSAESKARSRRNLNIFSFFNGFSYMCLGETVIILFAVRLELPDYGIAVLGAMIYLGFLLLPLGRLVAGRVGAAQSQAVFWVLRNLAGLLVASAAVFARFGRHGGAMAVLLLGAFLFYGFRAAGVILSQPLNGEVTDSGNRAGFIARNIGLHNLAAFIALAGIGALLHFNDRLWVLIGIILVGSSAGIFSARYLRRVEETGRIRDSARSPLRGELRRLFRFRAFRAYVMTSFTVNVAIIMTVSMSMLMVKRGYGVRDTDALLFSMGQLLMSFIVSRFSGKLADRIGPRRVIIGFYFFYLAVCLLWIAAPGSYRFGYLLLPFLFAGTANVAVANSLMHYFLTAIPSRHRVSASILSAVITGAAAGLLGSLLVSGLLRLAFLFNGHGALLTAYRLYFVLAALVILAGAAVVTRLKILAAEPEFEPFQPAKHH